MQEELKTETWQYFRNSSEQLQSRVVTDAWRNRRGVPVCLCPARLGSHFTAVVSISGPVANIDPPYMLTPLENISLHNPFDISF